MRYCSGDELDACRDLLRQGVPLATLAARLQMPAGELATLLGLPIQATQPPCPVERQLWGDSTIIGMRGAANNRTSGGQS